MKKIYIINGPNLNLLGQRENDIYGNESFELYLEKLKKQFQNEAVFTYFQSNIEGELVNIIQEAKGKADAIIINAAAYTHTSIAIGDALRAVQIPTIEVHLSHIFRREEYRHVSMLAGGTQGVISGFGLESYRLAAQLLTQPSL